MNTEVIKLYPETQVQEIQLSYPEGHIVFAKPLVGLKGIASIGDVLTKALMAIQGEGTQVTGMNWGQILTLLLPRFPEVVQEVLRVGYGDAEIDVEKLYTQETVGLLNVLLDQNEGLEEHVRSFFARFRPTGRGRALPTLKSPPSLSPEATP
jgi:hypothetical protein